MESSFAVACLALALLSTHPVGCTHHQYSTEDPPWIPVPRQQQHVPLPADIAVYREFQTAQWLKQARARSWGLNSTHLASKNSWACRHRLCMPRCAACSQSVCELAGYRAPFSWCRHGQDRRWKRVPSGQLRATAGWPGFTRQPGLYPGPHCSS